MTHANGEESPESDEVLVESPLTVPSNHCLAVASVSPTNALASGSGGLALAEEASTGSAAADAAHFFQSQTAIGGSEMLAPLVEERDEGQAERQEAEVQDGDPRDEDGAIYFDDGSGGEGRGMQLFQMYPTPAGKLLEGIGRLATARIVRGVPSV